MVKRLVVWVLAVIFFVCTAPTFAKDGSGKSPHPNTKALEHANENAKFKRTAGVKDSAVEKSDREAAKALKESNKKAEKERKESEKKAEKLKKESEKEAKKKQKEIEKQTRQMNKGIGK